MSSPTISIDDFPPHPSDPRSRGAARRLRVQRRQARPFATTASHKDVNRQPSHDSRLRRRSCRLLEISLRAFVVLNT